MTRLDASTYLDHIGSESARFRTALTECDPAARVPSCPDWDAADLLWHLTGVQWFWSRIVADRPAGPETLAHPPRPSSYDDLLAAFDRASAGLVAALGSVDPSETAWSWSAEQTAGFTFRRQAHEALIHRVDAEQTAGTPTPLDAALAADGVAECLSVMYGGCPPWGRHTASGRHVRVEVADLDVSLWVSLGRFTGTDPDSGVTHDEDHLTLVDDPGQESSALVRGTAADLDTWLWKRTPATGVELSGDADSLAVLAAVLGQSID